MLYILIAGSLVSQSILDNEMNLQERKKTGVYKLSAKEKTALYAWIEAGYVKRETPLAVAEADQSVLEENLRSGSYIRLSNNTLWNIHPDDVPVTQGWITPVDITVSPNDDPQYPFKLTNTLSGSSVRAKKVTSLPPVPPSPAAPSSSPEKKP